MNRTQVHPMAYRQMGGFLDDLWDDVTDKAKDQVQQIINQAPAQIANAAAGAITNNPKVQEAAKQSATQAAIDKAAAELTALKDRMALEIAAAKKDPVGWIKANPVKVMIAVGVVTGLGAGVYFIIKGMRK